MQGKAGDRKEGDPPCNALQSAPDTPAVACHCLDRLLEEGTKLFACGGMDKESEHLKAENQRLKGRNGGTCHGA